MEDTEFDDDLFEHGPLPLRGGIGGEGDEAEGLADGLMGVLDRDDTLFDSDGRIIIARNADLDPHEITKIVKTKDTALLNRNLYCFLCCLSLETCRQGIHASLYY